MRKFLASLLVLVTTLTMSPAAWAGYLLKAGDALDIVVWQDQKLNRRLVIAPDGRVSFPLAGHFVAGGRSVEAVETELRDRLQKQYKDQLDVSVSIAQIKEIPPPIDPSFFVTGEIKKPGQYFFKTRTDVLQAISIAGGLGTFASDRHIKIRRVVNGQETLHEFNYDAFTKGLDSSGNIRLKSGDVIIVPEKGIFE
jgi:polysaccharide biosynthesis/export protein